MSSMKRDWVFSHELPTFWICLLVWFVSFSHYFNYNVMQLLSEVTVIRNEAIYKASTI